MKCFSGVGHRLCASRVVYAAPNARKFVLGPPAAGKSSVFAVTRHSCSDFIQKLTQQSFLIDEDITVTGVINICPRSFPVIGCRTLRCGSSSSGFMPHATSVPPELRVEPSASADSFATTDGSRSRMDKALLLSGGAVQSSAAVGVTRSGFGLWSAWGVVSVVFILMNAIKRLAPIALHPFQRVSHRPDIGRFVSQKQPQT